MKYFYKEAVNRFMQMLFKEPQVIFMSSLIFALIAVPLVTAGLAAVVSIYYCAQHENGYKCRFRQAWLETAPIRKDALLMGFMDIAVLLVTIGSGLALLSNMPAAAKVIYAVLLQIDILFLFTGFFRYAALVREGNGLKKAILSGTTMAMANLGWLFLYGCLLLMLFMICCLTGIGVVMIFPGAASMLSFLAWNETVKRYQLNMMPNKQEGKAV